MKDNAWAIVGWMKDARTCLLCMWMVCQTGEYMLWAVQDLRVGLGLVRLSCLLLLVKLRPSLAPLRSEVSGTYA